MKFFLILLLQLNLPDAVDSALSIVHKTRKDLGYNPAGYWLRYPNPRLIPLKIPAFDDLFREPLKNYVYVRTMGNVVSDYLDDSVFTAKDFVLHRLLYFLGVDRKITGFRNYSTNLKPRLCEQKPLFDALMRTREITGVGMNSYSFGGEYGSAGIPDVSMIPENLRKPLARLVLNALDAYKWWKIAIRNVDPGAAAKLLTISPEKIGVDDQYVPEFDDVYSRIDEHSLYYSAMKLVDAAEKFAKSVNVDSVDDFVFSWMSPIGEIVFAGGADDTFRFRKPPFIYVNFGGNDLVVGPVGVGLFPDGISISIDLAGDDHYLADSALSQGVGFVGNGILLDMDGDDIYEGEIGTQGVGIIGMGMIFDNSGKDSYHGGLVSQGAGINGLGFLIDRKGDDSYYIFGEGQGAGIAGGIGILADGKGNDFYVAEPFSSVFDLGDYHSHHKINANGAQGYGGGRRADGSDGHSYAGGLGALLDVSGNDRYYSGNWTLGVGYWYGIGVLWDGAGDDLYSSCYFTQGSGAHYAIGVFVDESGNDTHKLFETAGAALGFGWDFVDALFFDRKGDDYYEAKIISFAVAEIRSNAFFFDLAGNDVYKIKEGTLAFGAADYRTGYTKPNRYSPFAYFSEEFGIFVDGNGEDKYILIKDGIEKNSAIYKNNSFWLQPDTSSEKFGFGNYGIGLDLQGTTLKDFKEF